MASGTCERGDACGYAHGEEELSERPQTVKTKMCHYFQANGRCANGDNCNYAHTAAELVDVKVLKTKLCPYFSKYGNCTRGHSCGFAHGEWELITDGEARKTKKYVRGS